MKAGISLEKLIVIALVALIALVTTGVPNAVLAQKIEKAKTPHAPSSLKTETGGTTTTKTATVPINSPIGWAVDESPFIQAMRAESQRDSGHIEKR